MGLITYGGRQHKRILFGYYLYYMNFHHWANIHRRTFFEFCVPNIDDLIDTDNPNIRKLSMKYNPIVEKKIEVERKLRKMRRAQLSGRISGRTTTENMKQINESIKKLRKHNKPWPKRK